MPNRTPADYAIEHAEYMAEDGERLLDAINALAINTLCHEDGGDVSYDEIYDLRDEVDECMDALRNRIYEFRKRRDRALAAKGEPS